MDPYRFDLLAAPHSATRQHGFYVKEGWGVGHTHSSYLPSSGPVAAVAEKREVGFKGLLDVCMRASLTPTHKPLSFPANGHVEVVGTAHSTPPVRRLVKSVVQGIRACQDPEASSEGLGGTYFFKNDEGRNVAIMKPCDEEPLAPNNPKGFVGRALGDPGLKPAVRVGEAAMREVAAYLLDHDHFASVPCTVLVRLTHPIFNVAADSATASALPSPHALGGATGSHESSTTAVGMRTSFSGDLEQMQSAAQSPPAKLGSLQEFIAHSGDSSERGASCFTTRDVHAIGILDLRLLNTDRHAGNLLCVQPARESESGAMGALGRLDRGKVALKPIDHGFCLPEALEPPFFEWLHWPQAMIPFDEEELAYIARLDPEADCELLRRELPWLRDECLRTLSVATTVLKAAAAAGLSLSEIGNVFSRPLVGMDEEPSELEKLCTSAHAEAMGLTHKPGMGRCPLGASWYDGCSEDDGDRLAAYGSSETGVLVDVQEEDCEDDMQFDLDEDSDTLSDTGPAAQRAHTHMGMPLHAGAHSSAAQLPVSTVSPASMSPTSPQRMRNGFGQPPLPPRRSTASSARSQTSSSTMDGASTIGPRGSADSEVSREPSAEFSTVQAQLSSKLSLDDGASSPEGPSSPGPKSLASGMYLRPGGHASRQRMGRRRAVGAACCAPPALGMGAGMGRALYPPAVESAAPSSTGGALASISGQQWPAFMAALQAGIGDALAAGKWSCAPPTAKRGGLLSSCPRF